MTIKRVNLGTNAIVVQSYNIVNTYNASIGVFVILSRYGPGESIGVYLGIMSF